MAFNAIIGALRVVLGADTAAFDTAMKEGGKKLKQFDATAVAAGVAVAKALEVAGGAIRDAIAGALRDADKLGKMAQQIGVPVEQLSALKYAAEQTGVSFDALGGGLKALSLKMAEAAADTHSGPARALAALGVSAKDASGQVRSAGDVVLELADKFKRFKDSAGKSKLAEELGLGELIPLLNKGRDGIASLTDEAARLGIVISKDTAESARSFNANLATLGATKEALITIVAGRLAPVMEHLSQRFVDYAKNATTSTEATGTAVNAFKAMATTIETSVAGLSTLRVILGGFWESISKNESADAVIARSKTMWAEIKGIWSDNAASLAATWNGWLPTVRKAMGETGNATAPAIEAARMLEQRLAAARAELTGLVNAPTQNFAEKMVAIQTALQQNLIPVAQQIQLTNTVLNQMREEARGLMNDLVNSPTETYTAKMQAVRDALNEGTISTREFGKLSKKVNDELAANWDSLASSVASTLTTMFSDNKTAAIAAAIINTAQGVTKALADGGFFGFAKAALVGAAGIAQIAKIKSTTLGSSGGGAGISAPSISPAATAPSAPAAQVLPSQTITVDPIDPMGMFSGEMMRAFAGRLLDYQRQGGQIVWKPR